MMIQQGTGMTSCSCGTKDHKEDEPQPLLIEEMVRGLLDDSEGGGRHMVRFFLFLRQ